MTGDGAPIWSAIDPLSLPLLTMPRKCHSATTAA
jgi:hypothetical protein